MGRGKVGQIWPFWKYEKYHGLIIPNKRFYKSWGSSELILENKPERQRRYRCALCQKTISREFPRLYDPTAYGQKRICPKCGKHYLVNEVQRLKELKKEIEEQIQKMEEAIKILDQIINDDYYVEKMAVFELIEHLQE